MVVGWTSGKGVRSERKRQNSRLGYSGIVRNPARRTRAYRQPGHSMIPQIAIDNQVLLGLDLLLLWAQFTAPMAVIFCFWVWVRRL